MKLGYNNNSLRFRLRRSEIEELLQKGLVEEQIRFTSDRYFCYVIRLDSNATSVIAQHDPYFLDIRIPRELGLTWCQSEMVSIEVDQVIDSSQSLHLLIEKDLPYSTRPDEDSDGYPYESRQLVG
jgi:hypothetical protein